MAAEDSAKKERDGATGEGVAWSALREQIRRARSSVPPGPAGLTPEPSGVRLRPPGQEQKSAPPPRVFGKTLPPPAMLPSKEAEGSAPAPFESPLSVPDRSGFATSKASASATSPVEFTSAWSAVLPGPTEDHQRLVRSRSETPRERRITAPQRGRPRRFEANVGYGVLPSLKDAADSSNGRYALRNLPPEVLAPARSTSAQKMTERSTIDRSRVDTPRQRVIPRVARRAPDEGDNTPALSRAAARRRSSIPPAGDKQGLPSVVVDPSLAEEVVQQQALPSTKVVSDERALPSVVIDPSLEERGAAHTNPVARQHLAAHANTSSNPRHVLGPVSHGGWDRRRSVAVKTAVVLGMVLLLGAALIRLG